MIDMSALYGHSDYEKALDNFTQSSCKWSSFQDVHLKVAKNRCPICECDLDSVITRPTNSGTTIIKVTIDHYRPQKYYSFLKCSHKNYLLMCSECNNIYKKSEFPLHSTTPMRVLTEEELEEEKPLIVNPINDNLLELFILIFRTTDSGKKVLELKPKERTGYLYEKALETIKLFGLGNCDTYRHSNNNVYNCRISILESHYGVFIEFAKGLKEGNRLKVALELREKKNIFESYGFYVFIQKNQFEVLT